jgi:signal transduction histidine kinase
MSKVINFMEFKNKRQKSPEFKVELSKKKAKEIQDSLKKINDLMKEIKEDARRQIEALNNKSKKDV